MRSLSRKRHRLFKPRRKLSLPSLCHRRGAAIILVWVTERSVCYKMSVLCCYRLQGRKIVFISWLSWLLWCSMMLSTAWGYVIVSSVSWSVTNEAEEDLDSSSNEEALPSLLEETTSIWKQSYPASVYKEDSEMRARSGVARSKQIVSPSRMFSYRRENVKETGSFPHQQQIIRTARSLAHTNSWGFLATVSTQEKIKGMPFGNCLPISDGPFNNSTGIPFFYVTPKDSIVADLMKNPAASLTLPETAGDFCRKNIIDLEDLRCARLTLTGQMVYVSSEEVEFAKQAVFSRHPVMRKWPRHYEWFFMKMNVENVWLQNWHGGVSDIATEEYFKAVPSKA
ncbi:protein CREG2 isoform X2 [Dromiciops gliroides]|uniref:protein CREG2 isoform X2 n=1 Tax=Dromiciops gliroides TaxID=33562 RepID=UPI001CC6F1D3|nr:protein CREG2 isoform X2 [Dromiciops gliroides]